MQQLNFRRNVLGLEGAHSAELDPATPYPIIDLLPEQKDIEDLGGTLRLGLYPCSIKEGTLAQDVYGKAEIEERHRHRYEFNNDYREQLEANGMVISGTSPDGRLVEMVEIPTNDFLLLVNSTQNSYLDQIVRTRFLNHLLKLH
ncbi:CTP synthase [Staphylococcus aureus]|uniref:CTP synthase n=1 Tax=Staphylococcus aureus TaxID=1280 RepID=A0A380DSV0_STAAU|nr:CTP synthase [Staphylococcus aureus]